MVAFCGARGVEADQSLSEETRGPPAMVCRAQPDCSTKTTRRGNASGASEHEVELAGPYWCSEKLL